MDGIRSAIIGACFVFLSGCSVGEEVARDQAKSVVTPIVEARFPRLNTAPITDCIIDNASLEELLTLAASAGTGSTAKATEVVVEITTRPETISCIAKSQVTGLLTNL